MRNRHPLDVHLHGVRLDARIAVLEPRDRFLFLEYPSRLKALDRKVVHQLLRRPIVDRHPSPGANQTGAFAF